MSGVTVYHYTTKKNAKAIRSSKMIKASRPDKRDALYGKGVYFTSMDPSSYTKTEIAENNWDGGKGAWYASLGKVDWVIAVTFPSDDRLDNYRDEAGRDVYLYPDDVHLGNYTHSITQV